MTKHLADHRTAPDAPRQQHFWALAKHEGATHPAVRALTQRPTERDDAQRLQHFLRIERGHTA
ncbi:hypothetical protein SAMN05216227_100811 [Pseudorhodobacter antarcticus]|jgi:hypothetical protein|uniref:Uncharacterized protein n=1 Tax=Pseudorhodobacter antarcticus TaxID=1077947 RepID=A0A1H8E297_9RHOB|nr:hypothetical protein [Pseudorhodobacter antarcticus]SEN12917.1 hypothetical protein SAMN05216227_100811 [Pseudorhodobacter antarcticus]